jgi:hypothetical protein
MTKSGLSSLPLSASVRELDAAQRECKLAAVTAYRTQLPALRMDRLVAERSVSLLNYELCWCLDAGQAERRRQSGPSEDLIGGHDSSPAHAARPGCPQRLP